MTRVLLPVLGLILLGIVAGFVVGVVVGVIVSPLTVTNADIANLRPAEKEDYVLMVSAAYALDHNLPDAQQRLARVDRDAASAAKYVADLAQRAIDNEDSGNAKNLATLAVALGAGTPSIRSYLSDAAAPAPTPLPTFTPTAAATAKPAALVETGPTATPLASDGPTTTDGDTATPTKIPPKPTNTPRPPTATFTPRPPTATFTPVPPTATPKPAVDFRVVTQRMKTAKENGGTTTNGSVQECGQDHTAYIMILDRNGAAINGIYVQSVNFPNVAIPYSGKEKPAGEIDQPLYGGDQFRIVGDVSGAHFTSEVTRALNEADMAISNAEFIAALYCHDDAECNTRKQQGTLCKGHYSYQVVFQRQ